MKNYFCLLLFFFSTSLSLAQVPQAINYQAVIRDLNGDPLIENNITLKVSITNDITGDNITYVEEHEVMTSSFGLIDIQIGTGTIEIGDFLLIEWKTPKFLVIEILLEGSSDFIPFGASQILSVPYALYADKVNDAGTINLIGDTLLIHKNTTGKADSIFFTSKIEQLNIDISTPVCVGDSIHFKVSDKSYDEVSWITPDNQVLNFQDTTFRVQNDVLISGLYTAILSIQGQTFELSQWVDIESCEVTTQDDFLIYKNQDYIHKILENDEDNTNILLITKINDQTVGGNALITLADYPSVNIRINEQSDGISIIPSSVIDTLLQFSVEVCDENNYCDVSTTTLKISTNELLLSNNIMSSIEAAAIIDNAQDGDTIDFNYQTILVQGQPLDIYKPLTIKNAIFKRACTSLTTLALPSSSFSDTIIVTSSEGFKKRDWILLVNSPDHLDNSSGQILNIKKISGDTIIIYQQFVNAMDLGAKVIHQFPLIRPQPNANINITFDNVVFDGNKNCNSYTYDWRYNNTISVGEGMMIQNSSFVNSPGENIFMCGGIVKNSTAFNLNGSFVHGSCPESNTSESFVLDNTTKDVCLVPATSNGHNEGWFTYSANTRFFTVEGNTAINGGESCFGFQGLDDFSNTFINNYFENFLKKKFFTSNNHPNIDDISNNIFVITPD